MLTKSMRPGCVGAVMGGSPVGGSMAYVPVDRPSRRNSSVDLAYAPSARGSSDRLRDRGGSQGLRPRLAVSHQHEPEVFQVDEHFVRLAPVLPAGGVTDDADGRLADVRSIKTPLG